MSPQSAPFELLFSFRNKISAEYVFFFRTGEIKSKILRVSTFRGESSAQSDSDVIDVESLGARSPETQSVVLKQFC